MSIIEKIKSQQDKSSAVHKKLLEGGYGLTKTFWLYWFIPITIFTFIEGYETTGRAIVLGSAMAFWSTIIAIGIFRTTGQKLWKNLALVIVVFDILLSIFAIFTYF